MPQSTRKISKWACDACKLRKVKCSSESPCQGCISARIPCTFNKRPLARGPRSLRAKTIHRINASQQQHELRREENTNTESSNVDEGQANHPTSGRISSTPSPSHTEIPSSTTSDPPASTPERHTSNEPCRVSTSSLVLQLCVYRLRLFPVWPIVDVEEIMGYLHRDPENIDAYALANALGAATIAQLKLDSPESGNMALAASMEAECQSAIDLLRRRQRSEELTTNSIRVSFFLHVYHENSAPGGTRSLLYLREAISMAQIMGLHREASYSSLTSREQRMRQRIMSLLFVTERGVAMLHKLPVILQFNSRFANLDESDDETHVLPAFKKLVTLFALIDQSGVFDSLHNSDEVQAGDSLYNINRSTFSSLQSQLREAAFQLRETNDIQMADIWVTTQWMQAMLWRASMSRRFASLDLPQQQISNLSHPIQIAKDFLEAISRLPSSALEAHGPAMEYKIFEIAKAVTDSVATGLNDPMISIELSRDVLHRLQNKLASFRGGNKNLLSLLHARISAALLDSDQRTYNGSLTYEGFPTSFYRQGRALLQSDPRNQSVAFGVPLGDVGNWTIGTTQKISNASNDNVPAFQCLPGDFDLAEALQAPNQNAILSSALADLDTSRAMELLFANSAMWDSVETWDFQMPDREVAECI
ncbi:Fungal Zn(2)-Cys(6) binuclear cluster domain-containing protein [Penicillium ucsense]|uniref:Fungal Zn(2)-Cys(6) binuclear cluster domain-containing protein n=1 Tax=Penicillium ucsense TaxID=2839758 RepID=A0A8J8W6R8_9EURO|nr:Fungal Zn(2)-Cys(6) binuclear cluster domain-containing protein [Penicillium ucsense]KAF7738555.1 Fungal Zn(2)-Cys(6) binuclear cluster domain-containing protein [Penicillium ucsense]